MRPSKSGLRICCALDKPTYKYLQNGSSGVEKVDYEASVVRALKRIARQVELRPVIDSPPSMVIDRGLPDVVFNLALSATDDEARFVAWMRRCGLRYTGSGPEAIRLANNKVRSRRLLHRNGIPIPTFIELPVNSRVNVEHINSPWIIKPIYGGSSVGVYRTSVTSSKQIARRLAQRIWKKFGISAVCDEFIVGREIRTAFVETGPGEFRMIGASEWQFSRADGREFKWWALRNSSHIWDRHSVSLITPWLSNRLKRELSIIGKRCVSILNIRGYATIDWRIKPSGEVFVIEVNANPGLSDGNSLWMRPSFECNIRRILRASYFDRGK
jgi:D-alanine-D-alanine ligase